MMVTSNARLTTPVRLVSLLTRNALQLFVAYGIFGDFVDEYMRTSDPTCLDSIYNFFSCVQHRIPTKPNVADITQLLSINESRGFPEILGNICCMHWKWNNCPFTRSAHIKDMSVNAWSYLRLLHHKIFRFDTRSSRWKVPTMALTWFNILWYSLGLLNAILRVSTMRSMTNNKGYYLATGIYSYWFTFVKEVCNPQTRNNLYFLKSKRALGRMGNMQLVSSKLDGLLFDTLPEHEALTLCWRW
jgi:hypothetical protein